MNAKIFTSNRKYYGVVTLLLVLYILLLIFGAYLHSRFIWMYHRYPVLGVLAGTVISLTIFAIVMILAFRNRAFFMITENLFINFNALRPLILDSDKIEEFMIEDRKFPFRKLIIYYLKNGKLKKIGLEFSHIEGIEEFKDEIKRFAEKNKIKFTVR